MSDLVVRLLAAISEAEKLAELESDGFGTRESWHTRQCGYVQGEWLEPCSCGVPASVLRLCQAHRQIIEEFAEHSRRYKTRAEVGPTNREHRIVRYHALLPVIQALAEGLGVKEATSDE